MTRGADVHAAAPGLEAATASGECRIAVDRATEADLLARYGLRISRRGMLVANLSPAQATYLQTHPTLTGPDAQMNRCLWRHLARRENWARVEWPPAPLAIEIHRLVRCPSPSPGLSLPSQMRSQLEAKYPGWLWSFHPLPVGQAAILVPGSMHGDEPLLLRHLEPRRRVVALDLSQVHCARMRAHGLCVCAGSLVVLPFRDGAFDAVYNNTVIEHIPHVEEMLREIARVLRPGGRFVFIIPTDMNESNPHAEAQWHLLGEVDNLYLADPDHAWKTDLHDLHHRLRAAGFRCITFAYRAEDLERHRRILEWRRRRGRLSRGLGRIVEVLEGSPALRSTEVWIRQRVGIFHRWTGWKRWLRSRLGLPDRLGERLNVLVTAERVAQEDR